ncbi:MAG: aminotransferase class I/II-fold pyridoxal phosphate-dependent enzyme [Oceanospirillaceae bacterium]|jgi:cobalamin biosynthetic protein CobC|nr:aminotransferase class I/II-fold pyridoxal phosphate-dependent enzyme [Oceanospirillaceae bacterium]
MSQLFHGGDLHAASALFGRPADDWLDLSTGINQHSYPAPAVAPEVWQRLPYLQPALMDAAASYYGPHRCLASSGSQPIIEILPQVLRALGSTKAAWLADVGYQEHRHGWHQCGPIKTYNGLCAQQATQQIDSAMANGDVGHLVIINPNNPTGTLFPVEQLLLWAQQLNNGFLVVDEAFIDTHPTASLLSQTLPDNLVILRSVGKFFGLAGIRLGFTFASPRVLTALRQHIGPWSVNGPAQSVAIAALNDQVWQQQMRQQLVRQAPTQLQLWHQPLLQLGTSLAAQHELFRCFAMTPDLAHKLHQSAAEQGILLRPVDINSSKSLLRFGNIDLSKAKFQQRCQTWLQSLHTLR